MLETRLGILNIYSFSAVSFASPINSRIADKIFKYLVKYFITIRYILFLIALYLLMTPCYCHDNVIKLFTIETTRSTFIVILI